MQWSPYTSRPAAPPSGPSLRRRPSSVCARPAGAATGGRWPGLAPRQAPPTRNEAASNPAARRRGNRLFAEGLRRSRLASFHLLEEFADLGQFVGGDVFGFDGAEDELSGGAAEDLVHEVSDHFGLGLFLALARAIHLRADGLVPRQQGLVVHDLHHLEGGGVAGVLAAALFHQGLVDLADGAGAA